MRHNVWTGIDNDTLHELGITRCHFKGSNSTTVQNNYRPLTADELRMQRLSTDYAEKIQPSAYQMYQQGMAGINNAINPAPDYSNLYHQQASQTAQNGLTAQNIANGILPQQFADNRIAQGRQYAQGTMGNLLNDMNSRGIINSSVTASGINGINDALANTFNNSYRDDLGTVSNLLNQSQNYANMPIQQANQAQNAAYDIPLRLFGAATGQMQPTQQIWQPTLLSNQSNPTSSTQKTSGGGGLFSGLMSGLGSYVGAGGKF